MRTLAATYVAVVVVVAIGMAKWRPATPPLKGTEMTWSNVVEMTVSAKPSGVWTWAVERIKGPARILIEAQGSWSYSPGNNCGPDGHLDSLLSTESAIMPKAPIGALLVKVGGSTAGTGDGTIRVAGSKIYFEIDKTISAPILLTINDELGGLSDNAGELKVKISTSLLPSATAPAGGGGASVDNEPVAEPKPDPKAEEKTGDGNTETRSTAPKES